MDDAVIACTLDAGDLKERLAWIAGLNARALKSARQDDLTLTLDYAPEAIADVRKMVAGEQKCCAFLNFTIAQHPDAVRVSVVAPETAREAAQALFEPLSSKRPLIQSACGCAPGCAV